MTRTLFHNARLHGVDDPAADAVLVDGERIGWIGAADRAPHSDAQVDLDGGWLAPAFVDAHVHATATGLALTGLDLSSARSLSAALDAVRRHAVHQADGVILGTGWDETRWAEHRPPTAEEIAAAAPGRAVYLARVDVHSAVVSPALLPVARGADGFDPSGWLRRDAHHAVRQAAYGGIAAAQREAAQRATRQRAAELGIGCLHELSGPAIAGMADLRALLALAAAEPGPEVLAYWGELDGVRAAVELGTLGAAGDLFVDGAIGSRTAALSADYADDPGNRGACYHDVEAVARHVAGCTRAGQQAGFHVIGDDAVATVLDGFRVAAERVGADAVRAARHRLEHVEMVRDVAALASYGIVASVQPAFDAFWGGTAGMYAERLGQARAATLNPFAALAAAGIVLAFGSDAPVTPLDPWGGVRAAVEHRTPEHRVAAGVAFDAHTRGGWQAARVDDAGVLAAGSVASFAVWDRVVLTGARGAGSGHLDDLGATADAVGLGSSSPACRRTVVRGRTIFDASA